MEEIVAYNMNREGGYRSSRDKSSRPERSYNGRKRSDKKESRGAGTFGRRKNDSGNGRRGEAGKGSRFDREARERLTKISRNASGITAPEASGQDPDSFRIEGRNEVVEAFRSGRTIDRLYILDGLNDGAIQTVKHEAAKHNTPIRYVTKERLDQMSETGHHQGVIANAAAYSYADIEDLFRKAEEKKEDPFFILLDDIEDPHNLGAIIRTANTVGAHGVIIPKDRAVGLTATVVKASAGALNYTPVCKVTNLSQTIDELKKRGLWFVCADMDGTEMYSLNLKGPICIVIGAEGKGVSRLVKEKCDMTAAIPMRGEINSLNASVAAGVLAYEVLRQRNV